MAPSHTLETRTVSPYAFQVNGEVFFDPHPGVQLDALQAMAKRVRTGEGPRRFFLRGPRGTGKSVIVRKGLLHGLAMAIPGLKYVVVRRNMPDLRSNHLIYLGAEMRKLGGDYHETHGIAKYENGSLGFYRQCEEESDVEKIVGSEAAILFIDEAPQIKWEHQRTIAPSLRVPKTADGAQPYYVLEVYSGNPIGESIEEMDRYFMDQDVTAEEDPQYDASHWRHIRLALDDNPSLDKDEYLQQFSGLPAHYRAAWVDGVRMESRTLFEVLPKHRIAELPTVDGVPLLQVPWIQVYRAFDMGFFPDPAVCVWFVVLGKRVIAVHEETWFRTDAPDLAKAILRTTKELIGDTPVGMTFVDPQIAIREGVVTVMDHLEMHGVPCEPSINDRTLYADAIHGMLGEIEPGVPKLQIYERGCPMLAKYLPKMRWDEKNPRKMADHKFDHWVVALAYFAISSGVLSVSETSASPVTEPAWMQWIRDGQGRKRGTRR
jgi:hypothetical protein